MTLEIIKFDFGGLNLASIFYLYLIYIENIDLLSSENFTIKTGRLVYRYLKDVESYYSSVFQTANAKKQNIVNYFMENKPEHYVEVRDRYHNESIHDIVKKSLEKMILKTELAEQLHHQSIL